MPTRRHQTRPRWSSAPADLQYRGMFHLPRCARVLTVLAREEKPLTAYEIVDRLKGSKKVQAVQVYRALDFLQEAGCIHRLASKASYFACDHEHHPGEAVVFMICSHCGTVQEVASEAFARGLRSAAKLTGFKPVHPTFEVEGECAECAAETSAQ
jgi:Fur family zinc uptake transcriptional regulator